MALLWMTATAEEAWPEISIHHLPETHGGRLVATHPYEDKPVGYLSYLSTPDEVGIDMLHTHKQWRKQGIGTALMNRLHEMYPEHRLSTEDVSDKGDAFLRSWEGRGGAPVHVNDRGAWWGHDGDDWED